MLWEGLEYDIIISGSARRKKSWIPFHPCQGAHGASWREEGDGLGRQSHKAIQVACLLGRVLLYPVHVSNQFSWLWQPSILPHIGAEKILKDRYDICSHRFLWGNKCWKCLITEITIYYENTLNSMLYSNVDPLKSMTQKTGNVNLMCEWLTEHKESRRRLYEVSHHQWLSWQKTRGPARDGATLASWHLFSSSCLRLSPLSCHPYTTAPTFNHRERVKCGGICWLVPFSLLFPPL